MANPISVVGLINTDGDRRLACSKSNPSNWWVVNSFGAQKKKKAHRR
jgi:hypothetical protein